MWGSKNPMFSSCRVPTAIKQEREERERGVLRTPRFSSCRVPTPIKRERERRVLRTPCSLLLCTYSPAPAPDPNRDPSRLVHQNIVR